MQSKENAPTRTVNLDECIYCVHYQALGCSGSTKFCTLLNAFLQHDPSAPSCGNRAPVEGAD